MPPFPGEAEWEASCRGQGLSGGGVGLASWMEDGGDQCAAAEQDARPGAWVRRMRLPAGWLHSPR